MSFGLLKTSGPPIAVDFGVSCLKLMQIQPGDPSTLLAAAGLPTPDALLDKPAERLAFQTQALPGLLKSGGFKGKRAVCSVSATQTFVQHLQVQRTDGADIKAMVGEQLRQLTGREPALLIQRHIEVGEVTRGGVKKTEVICLAMPRDAVIAHMKSLRACRLEPVGVHTEHLAMLRSLGPGRRRAADADGGVLIVDIGFASTKVVVAHGREPAFAKTIHVAGRQLDATTAKLTGCTLGEARRRRTARNEIAREPKGTPDAVPVEAGAALATGPDGRSVFLAMGSRSAPEGPAAGVAHATERRRGECPAGMVELSPNAPGPSEIPPAMAGVMETLADEIAQCLRYHQALFPDKRVDRIVFFGGEAERTDMCRHIARSTRLPAYAADPFSTLLAGPEARLEGVDLSRPAPGWMVPLGLCLSPTDC